MMAVQRPVSPVNVFYPANTGSLVHPPYPAKRLTETKIAPCNKPVPQPCKAVPRPEIACAVPGVPQPDYTVLPCECCHTHAREERLRYQERNPAPVTSVDGAHNPYQKTSVNSNKKNKQAGAPVERTLPDLEIHAVPGTRRTVRVHDPYVPACDNGVCTGHCANGICTAGITWNGVCTGQDICKMLSQANHADACICHLTESVPKRMVACLDWVNCGKCDPTKRGFSTCPFAHPDLTGVHPDVCCNYLLTGICRFRKSEEEKAVASTEGQKKKRNGRNRGPTDCLGCHCADHEGGVFPLLPGLTKKILRPLRTEGNGQDKKVVEWDCTDLNRALALYKLYLRY